MTEIPSKLDVIARRLVGQLDPWDRQWRDRVVVKVFREEWPKETLTEARPDANGIFFVPLADADLEGDAKPRALCLRVIDADGALLGRHDVTVATAEAPGIRVSMRPPRLPKPDADRTPEPAAVITQAAQLGLSTSAAELGWKSLPTEVAVAIQALNDLATLAGRVRAGHEDTERLMRNVLATAAMTGARTAGIVAGRPLPAASLEGSLPGFDGPCGGRLGALQDVLQAAFQIDFRERNEDVQWTAAAAGFLRQRLGTIDAFAARPDRWATDGRGGIIGGDEGIGGLPGDGRLPPGGPGRPGEPGAPAGPGGGLLPPDEGLPPGVPRSDPCDMLEDLCIGLFQELAAASMRDQFTDLIATVTPNCLCSTYDANQIFTAQPAVGRQFPDPLPPDVFLMFREEVITPLAVSPQQIQFRIPSQARTGFVYLRRLGALPTQASRRLASACGRVYPIFPSVVLLNRSPAALISIIYPPVVYAVTADGEAGQPTREACTPVDICWRARLADQPPSAPLPPCGEIQVEVRDSAGAIVAQGGPSGCITATLAEDQTYTTVAKSLAGGLECGTSPPMSLGVRRVRYLYLERAPNASTEILGGTAARFTVRISCPAPAGGLPVSLVASDPTVVQVPARILIPSGQQTTDVDFQTVEACQEVEIEASASRHVPRGSLTYFVYRSPNLQWAGAAPTVTACSAFAPLRVVAHCLPSEPAASEWELVAPDRRVLPLTASVAALYEYDVTMRSQDGTGLVPGTWSLRVRVPRRGGVTSNNLALQVRPRAPSGSLAVPRRAYEVCFGTTMIAAEWRVQSAQAMRLQLDGSNVHMAGDAANPLTTPCGAASGNVTVTVDGSGDGIGATKDLVLQAQGQDGSWQTVDSVTLTAATALPNPLERYVVRNYLADKLQVYTLVTLNGPVVARLEVPAATSNAGLVRDVTLPGCQPVFVRIFTETAPTSWPRNEDGSFRQPWNPKDQAWALQFAATAWAQAGTAVPISKVEHVGTGPIVTIDVY